MYLSYFTLSLFLLLLCSPAVFGGEGRGEGTAEQRESQTAPGPGLPQQETRLLLVPGRCPAEGLRGGGSEGLQTSHLSG